LLVDRTLAAVGLEPLKSREKAFTVFVHSKKRYGTKRLQYPSPKAGRLIQVLPKKAEVSINIQWANIFNASPPSDSQPK
jgi:hypothetical protein